MGLYVLRNFPGLNGIIYIGKSLTLKNRLLEHYNLGDVPEVLYFDWYPINTSSEIDRLEREWIIQYNPKYNQRI
ncbi:GIY-YIG nuclease family protein [Candidatus Wolfebacteria bacterium]|nr:GIY-YIG nuclease family protein [Candidatus Wolfebacteria bacterium]